MSQLITAAPRALAPLSAPTTPAEILADALGRIITGRPLPPALRRVAAARPAPATAREGIERILAGPAPAGAAPDAVPS
jgi:hypothetical protein